jgi:hypothetical protein
MANLKTRLDGQFAALAKKLEAERATIPAPASPAPAPKEAERPTASGQIGEDAAP